MVSQKFPVAANRESICNFQQLSGILKFGPKPWNLMWQDFSVLLTFVVLSVILFFPARQYCFVREKIKIQLFYFSCYTPLFFLPFFFFYAFFLGNFSIFCKLRSFQALTFQLYISLSSFLPLSWPVFSFVHDFWQLDFIGELWDTLDAFSL